jgi:hypothetical protein
MHVLLSVKNNVVIVCHVQLTELESRQQSIVNMLSSVHDQEFEECLVMLGQMACHTQQARDRVLALDSVLDVVCERVSRRSSLCSDRLAMNCATTMRNVTWFFHCLYYW